MVGGARDETNACGGRWRPMAESMVRGAEDLSETGAKLRRWQNRTEPDWTGLNRTIQRPRLSHSNELLRWSQGTRGPRRSPTELKWWRDEAQQKSREVLSTGKATSEQGEAEGPRSQTWGGVTGMAARSEAWGSTLQSRAGAQQIQGGADLQYKSNSEYKTGVF